MEPEVPAQEQSKPETKLLTQEEFLTLWTIDYLEYRTPEEVAKMYDMDLEHTTLIFMKLEDIGFLKFEMKNKQIVSASATPLGQEALKEERYYDYVPE